MAIYAELSGTVAVNTLVCEDPAYAASMGWIDVDGISPQPGIGWTYDASTKAWTAPPPPGPTPYTEAHGTISTLLSDMSALQSQIAADAASVANWSTLSASDQAAIMGRVVTGFASTMSAIYAHLVLTGNA